MNASPILLGLGAGVLGLATQAAAQGQQIPVHPSDFGLEWAFEGQTTWHDGSAVQDLIDNGTPVRFRITGAPYAAGYWGMLVGQVYISDATAANLSAPAANALLPHLNEFDRLLATPPAQLPAPSGSVVEGDSILPAMQWGAHVNQALGSAPISQFALPLLDPPGSNDAVTSFDGRYHRFTAMTRCFYHSALEYVRSDCNIPENYADTEHFDMWALLDLMTQTQTYGGLSNVAAHLRPSDWEERVRLRLQMVLFRDQTFDVSSVPAEGTDTVGSAEPPGLANWHDPVLQEPPSIIMSNVLEFDLTLLGPAGSQWLQAAGGSGMVVPQVEDVVMHPTNYSVDFRMQGANYGAVARVQAPGGGQSLRLIVPSGQVGLSRIYMSQSTQPNQVYKIVELVNSVDARILTPAEQVNILTGNFQ